MVDPNNYLDICLEVEEEFDNEELFEGQNKSKAENNTSNESSFVLSVDGHTLVPGKSETFDILQPSDIFLYSCPQCHYKAQLKYYLIRHIKRAHKTLSYLSVTFTCPLCVSRFQGLENLHKHCLKEHSETLPKVTCELCFKVVSKHRLIQHIKRVHSHTDTDGPTVEEKLDHELRYKFQCSDCEFSSQLKSEFNSHVKESHGDHSQDLLPCPRCEKMFLGVPNLHRHTKEEHELILKLDHKCPECGKEFNKKSNLETHVKSVHRQIRYQCEYCNKELSTLGNKTMHVKKFHEYVL